MQIKEHFTKKNFWEILVYTNQPFIVYSKKAFGSLKQIKVNFSHKWTTVK